MKTIILGAGIIGLLTARALADRNISVVLVDKGDPGQEASWAGGGILSPLCPWHYPSSVNELAKWGQLLYPRLCTSLFDSTGIDPEYWQCGLWANLSEEDDYRLAQNWLQENNAVFDWLSPKQAIRKSACQSGGNSILYLPEISQVRNPRLIKALLRELSQRPNVKIISRCHAKSVVLVAGKVSGIDTSEGRINGDVVVLSAGAWSGQWLVDYGVKKQITPVKGQMLAIQAKKGILDAIWLSGRRYLIPRKDGLVLVGSTLEHTAFNKGTTPEVANSLRAFATQQLPKLSKYPVVAHWAGLRPGSENGVPIIGRVPNVKGLYINTGHFRNGLVLAPGSAELLAEMILDQPPSIDPNPYRPS